LLHAYSDLGELIEQAKSVSEQPVIVVAAGLLILTTSIIRGRERSELRVDHSSKKGSWDHLSESGGGCFRNIPVARVVNLSRALEQLKAAGFDLQCGLNCKSSTAYGSIQWSVVLVVGSEGEGLSLLTQRCVCWCRFRYWANAEPECLCAIALYGLSPTLVE